ncbi:Ig-like domain-containing protein, partial [Christiangramia aquimixticola]|uniref:Ig-like domain-containing protein n=1 Tax=Christiangramia aquimixticola TaxID=1697558 RepID=UPI003AA826D0
ATDVEVTSVTQPDNGTVVINPDGTVTYTPNPDYNGTDTFEYTATVTNADGSTTIETTTVTVNVEGTPDAVADNATTSEDEAVVIDVLDNDTYDPATDVEVTSVTQPDNGTVVINPDGTVTYTPNPDYNGTDTFEYTATVTNADGSTTTETTTVTVNVEGTADAMDDYATTLENTSVTVEVLENDTFNENTDIEITGVTTPANGTATINPDGTITYIPGSEFYGNDEFEYTVTVTNADGSTTTENATVFITVDKQPDGPQITVTQPDCSVPTGSIVIDPIDGYTYSFNGGNFETTGTFEQLAPGIYTIVAMDSKGYKSEPVSIEILTQPDTPDAPVVLEIYEASCDLPTASIIIEIEDGISYYLKNEAGEVIVNSENDGIFEDLVPGEYMIYAESGNGCISAPTSLVIEEPQATEIETEPLELCIGDDPEDLFELFPEGIDKSGTWVDPANTGALNDEFLDPKFLEVGTYTFTYVLDGNCPSETNVTVTINDLCEVLNCELSDIKASISKVVTPNGDNNNDYFMVDQDVQCDLIYDVMIFNRWGAKVFEAENYQNNWDGQSQESVTRSNQLPAGTYYYIVKMRDSDFKPIQGYIYLGTK